jgi:hypothetical protein
MDDKDSHLFHSSQSDDKEGADRNMQEEKAHHEVIFITFFSQKKQIFLRVHTFLLCLEPNKTLLPVGSLHANAISHISSSRF